MLLALGLLLSTAACEDPADYLPKDAATLERPALAQAEAVRLVRDIVGPCERAMEQASAAVGALAAAAAPGEAARPRISQTKDACRSAFARLQTSPAPGDLRDACLAAVYARESVADTALQILDGRATSLSVSTLQYKTADQAAASRACMTALARAAAIPLRP